MRRLARIAAVSLAVAAPAAVALRCKPPAGAPDAGGSEAKTLENAAAGKTIRINECGTDPRGARGTSPAAATLIISDATRKQHPEAEKALLAALAAVPADAQEYFVREFRGEIEITGEATAICAEYYSRPGDKQFLPDAVRKNIMGCYKEMEMATTGARPRVRLLFMPDAASIRHNTVRLFGFLFGTYYTRKLPDGRLTAEESAEMQSFKADLTQTFLRDMLDNKVFSLSNLEGIMGAGQAAVVERNYAESRDGDLLRGVAFRYESESGTPTAEQRKIRVRRLQNWLFSEAYDSYYCRPFSTGRTVAEDRETLEDVVRQVRGGGAKGVDAVRLRETRIAGVTNTRQVFETLFPTTYCLFEGTGVAAMNALVSGDPGDAASDSCKLIRKQTGQLSLAGLDMQSLLKIFTGLLPMLQNLPPPQLPQPQPQPNVIPPGMDPGGGGTFPPPGGNCGPGG